MKQLANALAYIHAMGEVHGNIIPVHPFTYSRPRALLIATLVQYYDGRRWETLHQRRRIEYSLV